VSEEFQFVTTRSVSRSPSLRDIAAVFFRNKRLLGTAFTLVFLAGLIYAFVFPSYKAEMKIIVRRGRTDPAVAPTPTVSPVIDRDEITEEEMNSELDLLHDYDILRKVALETGLAGNASWLSKLSGDNDEIRIEHATRRLARKLQVQPLRKSRLITVTYSSSNPRMSAAVLSSLARAFLEKQTEIRRPSGQQVFFELQMNESRQALERAEEHLLDFTRRKGVASAALERDLTLQRLSEAEASDLALQASVAQTAVRAGSLERTLHTLPERRVTQIRTADNPQLQEKIKSTLLELELRPTELLTKFQPSYRLVHEVDEQIAQTRTTIEAEHLNPLRDEITEQNPEYEWAHSEQMKNRIELQSLQKRQAIAHLQVWRYRAAAQKLGENAITQDTLEQRLKAAQEKLLLYANKREEARIGDALDEDGILNIAVAEQPHVPALPAWPLWAATFLSFAGACFFSTGLVFVADYFDPSFRTPDEVVQFLGTPVLGSLPASISQLPRHTEAS
jgi:uncharacterized protein involved in exopolysaccharide biosynthesis